MRAPLRDLWAEWSLELQARRRAAGTIRNYRDTLELFDEWLAGQPEAPEVADATRQQVAAFIAGRHDVESPQTVLSRFRRLRAFYRWAVGADPPALDRNPMAGLREPSAPEEPPPVLTDAQLKALFAATKGPRFVDRRDLAMMAFLADTGCRVGELVGLTREDVDLEERMARVTGKGDRTRVVAFGPATGKALAVYLRLRRSHRYSALPDLWLGARGPLREAAVWKIVRDRGQAAGIDGMFPHQLRHTFAHHFRAKGGSEGDLAELGGWKSPAMLRRYGKSAASERAIESHRRLGLLDDVL